MDILSLLKSSEKPSLQRFSIYLPDKGKRGTAPYDLSIWVDSALYLLSSINGGGTSIPNCPGGWASNEEGFMPDSTTIVYSLIRNPDVFEARFREIVAFISEFGTLTQQECVMIELSDGHRAYFIDQSEYQ